MGPRKYALEESQTTKVACRSIFLMWVDGVLDTTRLQRLCSEPGVVVEQHANYVIAQFTTVRPKRQSYRYLDPHRFIVQMDESCKEVEVNFNPTAEEIQKLRDFYYKVNQMKRPSSEASRLPSN